MRACHATSNSRPPEVLALIPTRWSSTRFPGKPLAMLGDLPVIGHVCRAVSSLPGIDLAVATDDRRIADVVKDLGYKAIMTSPSCLNGTHRCREALDIIGDEPDIVINVQGDEPFIAAETIAQLAERMASGGCDVATVVRRITPDENSLIFDPDVVKVVLDDNLNALYFSRAPIPWMRDVEHSLWAEKGTYYVHTGIYAFTPASLRRAVALLPSPPELAESLEQLRWLAAGMSIGCILTDKKTIGIDTPADLEAAKRHLK